MEFAKICCEGRAFPLKVQIVYYCGEYDLVFSTKEKKPTLLFQDFKFTQEDRNLTINYNDMSHNWIYMGIYAKDFTHVVFDFKFSGWFVDSLYFYNFFLKTRQNKKKSIDDRNEIYE